MKKLTRRLSLAKIRDVVRTMELRQVSGGEPGQSEDGHVCESFNSCPGSVVPYACSTDVRCDTIGPCDLSFGPCG